ncbi:MAG: hypothetical protein RSB95_01075 [Bacilli bacterium]
MKNKIFLISAACLLSVGLTSCESSISSEEAKTLLNSYNASQEFDALNSIVYTASTITNGESTLNQIVHIDLKDLYYYSSIVMPNMSLEALIFKADGQYNMCSSLAGSCVSISAPEAQNQIATGKTSLASLASFNSTSFVEFSTSFANGSITYTKKGNALTIDANLSAKDTESKHLLELNDRGLITHEEVSIVTPTTSQIVSIKAEYNVAITKKTQL